MELRQNTGGASCLLQGNLLTEPCMEWLKYLTQQSQYFV